jgi:hypothetical protein
MKKYIHLILLLGNSFISSYTFCQFKNETEFFNFDNKNNIKNNLGLFLKLDSNQIKTEKGIRFSVRLKNKTGNSLQIKNILDFITVNLLNEKKEDICIKSISRIYTDSKLYKNEAFEFEAVNINGEFVNSTTDSLTQKGFITIPSYGNYEIFLKITKIQKISSPKKSSQEKVAINLGLYLFSCSFGIIINNELSTFSTLPKNVHYTNCINDL